MVSRFRSLDPESERSSELIEIRKRNTGYALLTLLVTYRPENSGLPCRLGP